jgi:copper/silver efflux system protein
VEGRAVTPETEVPKTGVVGKIIAGSAKNPLITILFILGLGVWGYFSLRRAPLDAIPDLSDAQVIVYTEWMGRSPDLVEDQITYPVSTALRGAPGVKYVRGLSMFGMSFIYVIFEDGTDIYWARSRVLEYLNQVQGTLPDGVSPRLGPDATGVGWVFQYALVDRTGQHDLADLRSIQDFNVKFALQSVPGVAEIASVGGFRKEYQVTVDPAKLLGYGITIQQVMEAVRRSNEDVGGSVVELAGHENIVRGRGYVRTKEDLEKVPLKVNEHGTPVLVRDVGEVVIGPDIRRGVAELNGEGEAVGGIVVMRYGQNALDVIDGVKARLEDVERTLPEGVEVEVVYDRSQLIRESIDTLRTTLIEEMVIVSLIIFLFLLHVRSALVPILTLPLGVLLAFIPMTQQHLTANIMSLGGIAVAMGAMVDASIIIIENIHKKLDLWERGGRRTARIDAIISAMQEVGPSIFFSLLVITVSFIPVFTLQGVEGRLFKPLAYTKTYSMGFAAVLSVTLTPALAAILIRGKILHEERHPLNRFLIWVYTPVVRFVVRHRVMVIVLAGMIVAFTIPAFFRIGNEFMPPLNEGAILYMPTAPPGMSDAEASKVLQQMDAELAAFPEVRSVFGKNGRAESPTDPAPFGMIETTIVLKPRDQWRPGMTWERLMKEMDAQVRYPGMPNIFWMPIQTRTEMLSTGIRSPLGIEVFGDSIEQIEEAAIAIERRLQSVPGTRSAYADRSTGGFYIDVTVDRDAAARYGLTVADVNEVIQTAIGGMKVSETVEGRERYPINVRYPRELRGDPNQLGRVLVSTMMGVQVPLSQVAKIETVSGPPMIRSEDGKLVGYVFVDTGRAGSGRRGARAGPGR